MKRAKITIIGAGNVGATCAQYCAMAGLGDVYLLDIPATKSMPKGKALDISEAAPVLGFAGTVHGTTDYADTVNSDVIVVTAGVPRKPGMSRDDLLATNAKIVGSVGEEIRRRANAVVIVVATQLTRWFSVCTTCSVSRTARYRQAGVLDVSFLHVHRDGTRDVRGVHAMLLGGTATRWSRSQLRLRFRHSGDSAHRQGSS